MRKKRVFLLCSLLVFIILSIGLVYSALTIKSLNAPDNASWHNTTTIKFDFTPMNNDTNSSIINCTLFGNFGGSWAAVSGNTSAILNGTSNNITYTPPSNGTFLWNVQCINNASHTNYSFVLNGNLGNRTIYIDQGIDVVNINLTDNNTFTTDVTPNINITFVDNMASKINYTLFVNGVMNVTDNIANDTRTEITFTELSNGTYVIIAMAKDNASNVINSSALTINIDTVQPNFTNVTNPFNNSIQRVRNVSFNFTPYDNLDPTLTYEIFINDTTNKTGATTANNTGVITYILMANGKYNMTIMLTDSAGNLRNSSVYNFSVNCTENWVCGDWTACSDGVQTRVCDDATECVLNLDRPSERRTCSATSSSSSGGSTITQSTIGSTPTTVNLDPSDKAVFTINKRKHSAQIKKIYTDYVTVTVRSDPVDVDLYLGKTAKVDVDEDGTYDIAMTLNELFKYNAKITFQTINEPVPEDAKDDEAKVKIDDAEPITDDDSTLTDDTEPEGKAWLTWLIIIVIIAILIAAYYYTQQSKPKKHKK